MSVEIASVVRKATIEEVASLLQMTRRGGEWKGPCPECGGTKRCWAKMHHADPGKVVISCRQCPNSDTLEGGVSRVLPEEERQRADTCSNNRRINVELETPFAPAVESIWKGSTASSDALRAYLSRRRVWEHPTPHPSIRWLPAAAVPALRLSGAGAAVYAFRRPGGAMSGLGIDCLTADGKLTDPRKRQTVGTKVGSHFKGSAGGGEIIRICEGELDAVALAGVYACDEVRASGMASNLLAACDDLRDRKVIFHPDYDSPGINAADHAALLLARAGRFAGWIWPPDGCKDAAEAAERQMLEATGL